MHDRRDGTFPASETIRLAELACSRVPVRVVLLDALRHVEPQPWARGGWGRRARDLAEAARLAGWWYALLGEQRRREPVAARR